MHVDFISVVDLVQDEIGYSTEAKSSELLFVTVGLENLTDFFNSKLVVIKLQHLRVEIVQRAIRGCEVDRHCHVDVPSCLQVVDKAWLVNYIKVREHNGASNFDLSIVIKKFTFLRRIHFKLFCGYFETAVEYGLVCTFLF